MGLRSPPQKLALVSPKHHSATQTGVAEWWVEEKTVPKDVCCWGVAGVIGWGLLVLLVVVGVVLLWGGVVLGCWSIGAKKVAQLEAL